MEKLKRKSGFYWVKHFDNWIIAKYEETFNCWAVISVNKFRFHNETEFTEIKEERILNPDEQLSPKQ